jgi:broad specificity phosphatase PhoE
VNEPELTGTETIVHVLRHGEVHNPEKILYGRLPGYRLSQLGIAMAEAAADWLAPRDVTYVVASPLERAQQTAEPIAARFGLPIETDDRLIESQNRFEGKRVSVGDGALRSPRNWGMLWNPFRPSWGEPYGEVAARVMRVVDRARDASRGQEAVCVSHQLPIWVTRLSAENRHLWHNPNNRECALGSVTSFTFDGDELTGVSYAVPTRRSAADPDRAQ